MAKVTDIQDKNGTSKEIQDKDLARRTAQSAVASSDYVLLEDTSGQYHKISKASFTEAVRGALGSVINSVAKGSDIAKVPVLDSNNDLGMGTLANIASVLGVPGITVISNSTDINSYSYKEGISAFYWGVEPVNVPTAYCLMLNIKYGSRSLQIVVAYDASQQFYYRTRDNGIWREWRVIDSHT